MRQTFSILVNNHAGVLSHVAGLGGARDSAEVVGEVTTADGAGEVFAAEYVERHRVVLNVEGPSA